MHFDRRGGLPASPSASMLDLDEARSCASAKRGRNRTGNTLGKGAPFIHTTTTAVLLSSICCKYMPIHILDDGFGPRDGGISGAADIVGPLQRGVSASAQVSTSPCHTGILPCPAVQTAMGALCHHQPNSPSSLRPANLAQLPNRLCGSQLQLQSSTFDENHKPPYWKMKLV